MRLRQLSLDLFGHFTDKIYDFGIKKPNSADFHVIYGPNEAGKTTTMEAFLRLLYGFPHRETYDFLHQRKNLSVSGLLEIGGAERFLKRFSSRNNSLVDQSGKALPETLLQAHLGGLSEEDYRHLLCLDDETIERGGEEIASSKGDIGRLLFSAAAGVSDLTAVLDHIRSQADALYRKGARSTEIARLKKELAEVERQIKDQDVSASQYRKLHQALELAQADEKSLEEERNKKRVALANAQARAAALPALIKIDQLAAAVTPFVNYPQQLDFTAEDLVELLTRQTRLQTDAERLEQELTKLTLDLSEIKREPQHLTLADELKKLDELRGRYQAAERDLPRRHKSLNDVLKEMLAHMQALHVDDEDELENLILSQAQLAELAAARDEKRDAYKIQLAEQHEVEILQNRLEAAENELLKLQNSQNPPSGVQEILYRFSAERFLPQYAKAQQAIADAKLRLRDALDALSIKGIDFDAVPVCSLSGEEAEEIADKYRILKDKLAQATQNLAEKQQDAEIIDKQIADIKSSQGLADDADAQAYFQIRDALWQKHKADLKPETAAAFEAAMIDVDNCSEKRLYQAELIGQIRSLSQRSSELAIQMTALKKHQDELETSLAELIDNLNQAIISAGLALPLAPSVFANWVKKRDAAAQEERRLQHIIADHQEVMEKAARLRSALSPLVDLDAPDFDTLINAALDLQHQEQEQADKIAAAEKDFSVLKDDFARRQNKLTQFEKQTETATNDWEALIEQHLGHAVSADIVEHSLDHLHQIAHLSGQRAGFIRQIEGMEQDQAEFTQKMIELAEEKGLDMDPDSLQPLVVFAELEKTAQNALTAENRWQQLSERKKEAQQELAEAKISLDEIDRQVKQLAQIFPENVPTKTLPQLRVAVADAANAIAQRKQLEVSTTEICAALSLPDLSTVRQELGSVSASELSAQIAGLEEELSHLEEKTKTAIELRSDAAGQLARVTGDADIAALTELKVTLEAQIEDAILHYLEFDLGHRLAEEAIRRYRDKHRSGMMDATEKIFSELTNGAYRRLSTQPDGNNETLLALDATGKAKQARDMSKGTRFQLYLALRAAAYEQLVAQGVCLPFFCDDIFETFDEERTRAACRVMARIGQSGQAIYLTHHRHVVDIALQECGENVKIHEITA